MQVCELANHKVQNKSQIHSFTAGDEHKSLQQLMSQAPHNLQVSALREPSVV
jgi:hypothetical protein